MPRLDEETLHKVRQMAKAGASPEYIASRYALPVEQVEFVCGFVPPGDRGTFGSRVPSILQVDGRRDDPCVPVSSLRSWRSGDRRLAKEHARSVANVLALLDPEYEAWVEDREE